MVMYGGVSLAIYMNGVAQEALPARAGHRARGAVAPPGARTGRGASRLLRRRRGSGRAGARGICAGVSPARAARRRRRGPARNRHGRSGAGARFVVDIVPGTSAGGINGVLLARAIANQENFDRSADLWIDVAGIDELLGTDRGQPDDCGVERRPESVLNGHRLYCKALEAMRANGHPPGGARGRVPAGVRRAARSDGHRHGPEGDPQPLRLRRPLRHRNRAPQGAAL